MSHQRRGVPDLTPSQESVLANADGVIHALDCQLCGLRHRGLRALRLAGYTEDGFYAAVGDRLLEALNEA
jgi:hypothetical protein